MADNQPTHRPAGEAEIVEAGEDLDVYTAAALRSLVCDLVTRQGRSRLVISLERTRFLDATGTGVLVGALRRTRAHDGWLSLVCTDEVILRRLRIIGLVDVLDVHPTVADALKARGVAGPEVPR